MPETGAVRVVIPRSEKLSLSLIFVVGVINTIRVVIGVADKSLCMSLSTLLETFESNTIVVTSCNRSTSMASLQQFVLKISFGSIAFNSLMSDVFRPMARIVVVILMFFVELVDHLRNKVVSH